MPAVAAIIKMPEVHSRVTAVAPIIIKTLAIDYKLEIAAAGTMIQTFTPVTIGCNGGT